MKISNRFVEITIERNITRNPITGELVGGTDNVRLKYYKILSRNGKWVDEDRLDDYGVEYFEGRMFIFGRLTKNIVKDLAEWGAWVKVAIKAESLYRVLKSYSGEPYVDMVISELAKLKSASIKGVVMPKSRLVNYFMLDETDSGQQEVEFFMGARSLKEHIDPVSNTSFFVFPVSVDNKNILSVVDGNYTSYFGTVLHPG